MSDLDKEDMARLGIQLGIVARKDPGAFVMAVLEYLLERSLGDNKALLGHCKLKAYRSIAAKLKDALS